MNKKIKNYLHKILGIIFWTLIGVSKEKCMEETAKLLHDLAQEQRGKMKGHKKIAEEYRQEAKDKAFDSLARYKFCMFGYWAATWVQMNKLCRIREANPFNDLVDLARKLKEKK